MKNNNNNKNNDYGTVFVSRTISDKEPSTTRAPVKSYHGGPSASTRTRAPATNDGFVAPWSNKARQNNATSNFKNANTKMQAAAPSRDTWVEESNVMDTA